MLKVFSIFVSVFSAIFLVACGGGSGGSSSSEKNSPKIENEKVITNGKEYDLYEYTSYSKVLEDNKVESWLIKSVVENNISETYNISYKEDDNKIVTAQTNSEITEDNYKDIIKNKDYSFSLDSYVFDDNIKEDA